MSQLGLRDKIKIYADGADQSSMLNLVKEPWIHGFTTNPTLMRKSGVTDYRKFCQEMVGKLGGKPVSFEVFADDHEQMYSQAKIIAEFGRNVFVKIPVMNTKREGTYRVIERLANEGVKINITAVFTLQQVLHCSEALRQAETGIISIFAGRIADTGLDPIPLVRAAVEIRDAVAPKAEILWASPREVLNIAHAVQAKADIITVPPDLLKKMASFDKDLMDFSHETVEMFYKDATAAGYTL
jgi:transaldolase